MKLLLCQKLGETFLRVFAVVGVILWLSILECEIATLHFLLKVLQFSLLGSSFYFFLYDR